MVGTGALFLPDVGLHLGHGLNPVAVIVELTVGGIDPIPGTGFIFLNTEQAPAGDEIVGVQGRCQSLLSEYPEKMLILLMVFARIKEKFGPLLLLSTGIA